MTRGAESATLPSVAETLHALAENEAKQAELERVKVEEAMRKSVLKPKSQSELFREYAGLTADLKAHVRDLKYNYDDANRLLKEALDTVEDAEQLVVQWRTTAWAQRKRIEGLRSEINKLPDEVRPTVAPVEARLSIRRAKRPQHNLERGNRAKAMAADV